MIRGPVASSCWTSRRCRRETPPAELEAVRDAAEAIARGRVERVPRTAAADAAWTGGAGAAPACWRAAARVAPLARAAAGTAAARKAGVALSARCRRPWAGAAVGRSATGAAAGVAGTPALTAAARGPGGGAAGCSTSAGSTPAIAAGRRGAAAGENRDRCDQRKGPSQVSRGLHSGHLAKVGNVDRRAVVQHVHTHLAE